MVARPHDTNILEWHYVLFGTPGSDYDGGCYHGKVVFPPQYPFKPPAITMCTPSGRFAVNTRLCLSMSDFHPETWNPLWSVASILTGLQSFFYSDEPTSGSVNASPAQRRQLASDSLEHCAASVTFCKVRHICTALSDVELTPSIHSSSRMSCLSRCRCG
jgi:ubiquitin-conjugating enzyme E2 J2